MSAHAATPLFMIPENAPFSAEQRVWLSGFLAAAIAPHAASAAPLGVSEAGSLMSSIAVPAGPVLASNEEAPWHDPAMPIDKRAGLASDRPLAPRLMAAMAQQDCGQCGYNCADYANAIFLKKETRLNLCAPGGKATARMVKRLADELDRVEAPSAARGLADQGSIDQGSLDADAASGGAAVSAAAPGFSREQPADAAFLSRYRLSGKDSAKDTWHIEIDIGASGLAYEAGDSLGIFPRNDPGLVDQMIATLGASHTTQVRGRTLREVLLDEVSLGTAPDTLFELFSFISGGATRQKARALAHAEDPDGDANSLDVLAVLHKFSSVRPHPEAFVDALEPLQPRLYSIASSPKIAPGRLALTIDAVRYVIGRRHRLGVASTYLLERAKQGDVIKAYVQKSHAFKLPADTEKPVIMVGPGTGIAPFRAFLQERQASSASGKNWLFFGHQHQETDFLYNDELRAMKQSGHLTRLSLAWSRDGAEKFYVQDRMREVGVELWQWLAQGAHFYVCGDAKRMAKDVEAALVDIVAKHGARSTDEAIAFVSQLKKSGRYQSDVY